MGKERGKKKGAWGKGYLLGMILFTSLATIGYHNATVTLRQQKALIMGEMTAQTQTYGAFKQMVPSGTFAIQDEAYLSRTVFAEKGTYTFVFQPTKTGQALVGIYQELPQGKWLKGNLAVIPTVAQLVTHLEEEVGAAVSMPDALTVETTKGFYDISYVNERAVELYQGTAFVGERPLAIEVEDHVRHFLEAKQKEIGAMTSVLSIERNDDKQVFYFETENGLYRLDAFYDGTADLLKGA